MRYVGVDGCKGGWIAVRLSENQADIQVYQHIKELWTDHSSAGIILIDIPIGLVETGDKLRERECDRLARKVLGRKASSLFSAPSRSALYEPTYEMSSQKNFSITGKKLTKQTYNIIPKIREVDEFLLQTPKACLKIKESHPELCFRFLSGGLDLDSKKTKLGIAQRIQLLSRFEPTIEQTIEAVHLPKKIAAIDDCLDAFVLAVTAKLAGEIHLLHSVTGDQEYYDSKGSRMDIVFFNPMRISPFPIKNYCETARHQH